ncbi:MAG: ATP-binding protein [Microscillaceae bacterium]|jgi:signal transduction histidine kinase|nr:ATP-binding protein [Microscillaceae bacterium]
MKHIFLFLLIIGYSSLAVAQKIINLKAKQNLIAVGNTLQYYEDPSRQLTIEQIIAGKLPQPFQTPNQEILNLGATQSAIWLKLTIQNPSNAEYLYLIDHVTLDSVFFYYQDAAGKIVRQTAGRNFAWRLGNIPPTHPVFKIPTTNAQQIFYVRLTASRYMYVESYVVASSYIIDFLLRKYMLELLYFGIILFAVFYNLAVYFFTRDFSYLAYVLYTFLIGLSIFVTRGYLGVLFPETMHAIFQYNFLISLLYNPFITIFTLHFLQVKKYNQLLYRLLQVSLFISWAQIALSVVGLGRYLTNFGIVFLFVNRIFHIWVGAVVLYYGYRPAIYYLISWGIFTILTTSVVLSYNAIFPLSIYAEYFTFTAIVIETVLCSLALADRIQILKKESQIAQQKNLELVKNQKENLEIEVKKRTAELEEKNQEIEAQNEELVWQQQELKSFNETLEEKNQEIAAQNEELHHQKQQIERLKNNLEDLVIQRTQELQDTLDNLTRQNQDLEQFSYIISHNLRAPVARIAGLVNFLDDDSASLPKADILAYLKKTTGDLDTIIKDLTQIIGIRNELHKTREAIRIEEVIAQEKFLLHNEITRHQASIISELKTVEELYSIKSYVHSILHNLLSNAIKYKSLDRPPLIVIKTEKIDNFVCLSVQDNGMGMDLDPQNLYKIFGLYKRMHSHVEGKGLGLFLVKTQIESLGGKIEVSSQMNIGTTFRVYFPLE